MIEAFDLPQIGRSPARFDFAKLESLNGHYIRTGGDEELIAALEAALPHFSAGGEVAAKMTPAMRAKLLAAMPGLKERAKTLVELVDSARFLWPARPLELDDKAKALLTPEARAAIGALIPRFAAAPSWNAAAAEAVVRAYAEETGTEARRGRAAAARGADRADDFAGNFRCAGRARQGGEPCPVGRSIAPVD